MTGIVKTDQIQGAQGTTVTVPTGHTLAVTNNATVGGTLGVTGNATAGGTLGVTGNTTVGGTLVNTGLITASAGVAVGGTGAANTLDDYEEGTWQPSFTNMNSSSTKGTYTKVGRLVSCNFELQANGSNSSVNVTGVPFAMLVAANGDRGGGIVTYHNRNTTEAWQVIPVSSSAFNLYHGAASRTITSSETVIGTFSFFTTS